MDLNTMRALLTLDEGVRLRPYVDTVGKLTIGIGHNLTDDGISAAVANLLFVEDLAKAQVVLQEVFPSWQMLDPVRQVALVDLAFNLSHRLSEFETFLLCLKEGVYDHAADALVHSLWYNEVGVRGPRIVAMIRTGQWPVGFHP